MTRFASFEIAERTMTAYDQFIGALDDEDLHDKLNKLVFQNAQTDKEFQFLREVGKKFDEGLRKLLFQTDVLRPLAEKYLVF